MKYSSEEKKRLCSVIKNTLLVVSLLLGYAMICYFTEFRIECPFHKWTGLECPGCGITRALLALLKLDFKGALEYNHLVYLYIAYGTALYMQTSIRYIRSGEYYVKLKPHFINVIMIVAVAVFFVTRNLHVFIK